MNLLRSTLYSIWLLPALASGLAQQVAGKPILSADPTPAAASGKKTAGQTPSSDPTQAAAQAALLASLSPNYIIGPDDSLQVTVWDNANLSASGLPVRPDGKISLPLINDIMAAGLTPTQLGLNIADKLKQFVTDPVVYVTVLGVRGKSVYMVGDGIGHQGPLAITPGMTVLQAIATAGGLSPYANKKGIYILRGDPAKPQRIRFDYKKALKGDMQGVSLVPGDTIVVP
jgi:polysaccharide export outer membrane protein